VGLLAEQIFIGCPPSVLEDLFDQQQADWLLPLLRLAGDEGEAAGLVLFPETPAVGRRQSLLPRSHRVEVGVPKRRARSLHIRLRWETTGYWALFDSFEGLLVVRPIEGQAVVSIEGFFSVDAHIGPIGVPTRAARRAGESAVRGLLGHLRSAVEESVLAG
jgi:hypothetical protein